MMAKIQQLGMTLLCSALFNLIVNTNLVIAATISDNIIEVKGQASVLVQPDHFSLSLAIIKKGRNTDKMRDLVNHQSNQILSIAKNIGITAKNINSARVYLRVVEDSPSIKVNGVVINQDFQQHANANFNSSPAADKPGKDKVYLDVEQTHQQQSKIQTFELSRTITITFDKIEDYDQFLGKVIKLGVERISPLNVSIANSEAAYQQALLQAIDNAKQKAQLIANKANLNLGEIVYITELSNNHYQARMSVANVYSNSASEHSSQVSDKAISANVLLKFVILE